MVVLLFIVILSAAGETSIAAAEASSGSIENAELGEILDIELLGRYTEEEIEEENKALFEKAGVPEARYEVDHYLIHFRSTDVDGSPVPIRAQLFIPDFPEPTERPVFVFAAGTTGISEKCAPIDEIPAVNRWGDYRSNMLAYAGQGYISIFPEYLGFGIPDIPQRYFSKKAEAHVMLDAVRAVERYFDGASDHVCPSEALFLSGFSQGGHAAHGAADLQPQYAPEIDITGLIGFGQTNDVATLMREMAYYSPYIIYTYAEIYGYDRIDPADYLQSKWMETFEEDIYGLCVEEFQYHYPKDGSKLFTPKFYKALHADTEGYRMALQFPEMDVILRENRAGFRGHGIPSLIVQGEEDIIVSLEAQERFMRALIDGGSDVQLVVLSDARHRDVRPEGFETSINWMEQKAEEYLSDR
ncbi:MAG: lipase family protein [Spirochaetia bacterium]